MFPYIVSYFLMFASAFLLKSFKEEKYQKYYVTIFALIWMFIVGCRHPSMGIDLQYGYSNGYWGCYTYIGSIPWKYIPFVRVLNYEHGYIIFNKILYTLNSNPQTLLIVCAVITVGAASVWIYRNSKNVFLSSVIYLAIPLFSMNFSGLRQALAVVITLGSYQFIKEKKFFKFLLVVLLASMFHSSAVTFLLAYPIYWIRMSYNLKLLSIAVPVLTFLLRYLLFALLAPIIKGNATPDDNNAFTLFFVFYIIYIYSALFTKTSNQEATGLLKIFLVAVCIQSMAGVQNTVMRVGYYYMPYIALLLPHTLDTIKHQKNRSREKSWLLMSGLIVVCFTLSGLSVFLKGPMSSVSEYRFFWQ